MTNQVLGVAVVAVLMAQNATARGDFLGESILVCWGDVAEYANITRNPSSNDYLSWWAMSLRVSWQSTWFGHNGDIEVKSVPVNGTDSIVHSTGWKDQFPPQWHYNTGHHGRQDNSFPPNWAYWQTSKSCQTTN